jgi:hypothetical protein
MRGSFERSGRFWQEHPERFTNETAKRWGQEFSGRVDHIVKKYQEQWTERRQNIMMEELEEMDKTRNMRNAEIRWENLLRKKEFEGMSVTTMNKSKGNQSRLRRTGRTHMDCDETMGLRSLSEAWSGREETVYQRPPITL